MIMIHDGVEDNSSSCELLFKCAIFLSGEQKLASVHKDDF